MKLNYPRTIFVGFAFFLICTFWQAYDTIIPKILTDKFGMTQAASGIVMALDNILALFLLPLLGGSVGALLGMRVFHHKTKHWYFVWGIPAILLAQLALAVWLLAK